MQMRPSERLACLSAVPIRLSGGRVRVYPLSCSGDAGKRSETKKTKTMILKIMKRTVKPFTGEDGEEREYFWYIGKKADGMAVRFGSTANHAVGAEEDFFLEEKAYRNGGKGYAEIVVDDDEE